MSAPAKISLCLIVKNEESVLEQGLKSIAPIADEIIIADTGSTDKTVQIAHKFTDQVLHFKWIDDFSAARNFSVKTAQYEYILRWDADFILKDGDMQKLLEYKQRGFDDADLVYLKWNIDFGDDGQPIRTLPNYFFYRRELFHWQSPIHNQLVANELLYVPKTVFYRDIEVNHHKDPVIKAHRYAQTERILKKRLSEGEYDSRLGFNYIENFLFAGKFAEAERQIVKHLRLSKPNLEDLSKLIEIYLRVLIEQGKIEQTSAIIEKYQTRLKDDPRFLLSRADIAALSDHDQAIKLYAKYIEQIPNLSEDFLMFNRERYLVHPFLMLGQLQLVMGDRINAKNNLQLATKSTHRESTKGLIHKLFKAL